MKKYIPFYSVPYVVLLVAVLSLLFVYPKGELHLMLNSCHTDFGDFVLRYYSQLAEWPLYVIALIPLLYKKWWLTVYYAVCELLSAGVVQTLKHIFHAPRPICYFEDFPDVTLPVVEGVHLHHSNSFPSGHTATFFVFFTFCALLLASRYAKQREAKTSTVAWHQLTMFLLFAAAALGGYSRVYLSQHFLNDVCVGSVIGVIIPCLVFAKYSNKIIRQ